MDDELLMNDDAACDYSEKSAGDAVADKNECGGGAAAPLDVISSATNDVETISGLIRTFDLLSPKDQTYLVQAFLTRMSHNQHNDVEEFLRAMLRRDFIRSLNSVGLSNLSQYILSFMDARTLNEAEQCSNVWRSTIHTGRLWRRLVQRKVNQNNSWLVLAKRRQWMPLVSPSEDMEMKTAGGSYWNSLPDTVYKQLYCDVVADLKALQLNWRCGTYTLKKIHCNSQNSKGVYCLQYDDDKIVSGLRDNTIKVWSRKDYTVDKILVGHTGSVLCLQYEGDLVITGSSDTTIRVWSLKEEKMLNVLVHHSEAVLHLRFVDKVMVTSSKDRTIAVWDINSPTDISLKRVLVGHRAAVNVVDFDSRYIVSASGDRTIKMWSTEKCEFYRTLTGHKRGIACLQYREDLIVSGSSDNTIRIWNVLTGCCIRTLEGHQELVRCIRFNDNFIVSGAYDGKIKVWDLKAALDPRPPSSEICIRTLAHHTGRVFRLQFDEFQIVSSSHDDTILVWDFLSPEPSSCEGGDCGDAKRSSGRPHPLSSQVRSALTSLLSLDTTVDVAMEA